MNSSDLRDRLTGINELAISFDGHFSYEEDMDDVHPREFRNGFEVDPSIVVVPKHSGSVLMVGQQQWPKMSTEQPVWRDSNLAQMVREIVLDVWGDSVEVDDEDRVVGTVDGTPIYRNVSIFARHAEFPDGTSSS